MGTLQRLAHRLDADERTLRRSVELGTIHAARPSPRSLDLDSKERDYLLSHWNVISALRRALRTEPGVRLAVLYGSVATGDDDADSDIDLLVDDRGRTLRQRLALRRRLEHLLDRSVHVVSLDDAKSSPSLLADALTEGRPIVDRDHSWPRLRRQRSRFLRDARREEATQAQTSNDALEEARKRLSI